MTLTGQSGQRSFGSAGREESRFLSGKESHEEINSRTSTGGEPRRELVMNEPGEKRMKSRQFSFLVGMAGLLRRQREFSSIHSKKTPSREEMLKSPVRITDVFGSPHLMLCRAALR